MSNSNDKEIKTKQSWFNKGVFNYSDKEKQTVFRLLGYEMTAPAGLKNAGAIYLSFIIINIFLFVFLKRLMTG